MGAPGSTTNGVMLELLDLREQARHHQPSIELPANEAVRHSAVATWRARMVAEHGSARVFEALHGQLVRAGLDGRRAARVAGFAEDERRHGVLCGAVVEALGGEAIAPALALVEVPEHPDVSPVEGAVRNLLSVSCLSETIAVALIGAERLEMPDGELRELLTRIYADECGHANFGWGLLEELLTEVDSEGMARLDAYLRIAFRELESHELAHLPVGPAPPPDAAALGVCDGHAARDLFYATVERVIVPGLQARGLGAQIAWSSRAS